MKIATYNVRVDTDYDQNWSWDFRKEKVLDLISYHDWDFLGVQEVRPNQVADLEKLTSYHLFASERDGDGTGEGLALLFKKSRFEIVENDFFWLSDTPDIPSIHPEAAYSRICQWALVKELATGKELLVINTHLDNISEQARFDGMSILLAQMQEQIAKYPTVVLGDFNAFPTETVHTLLMKDFVNTKAASLTKHYGPYGSYQDFKYEMPWSELEEIDYLYVKDFSVMKSAVLTDSCDQRFPSDHFPIESEIILKNE